jgi:transposase-like protein
VFQAYADGLSLTRIVKMLNENGTPSRLRSSEGWSPATVGRVLDNDKYQGRWTWNKKGTRRDPRTGRRRYYVSGLSILVRKVQDVVVPAQQPATALVPGRDYPRRYSELRGWFPDDEACLDYLSWLRWPCGFECPRCERHGGSRLQDGRYWCEPCRRRISITTGTVFHGTRTPLTVWFAAAWYMTSSKNGVAALSLHRLLGFGSYQTAWAMLHRLRTAMVRPGRDRLSGVVEVDETFFGGVRPGKRGRGAAGKALVAVAVELHEPKGFGRCRLRVIPDAKAVSLDPFLRDYIEPGVTFRAQWQFRF